MASRRCRERQAAESARWAGFSPLDGEDWREARDADSDEYPEPEAEEPSRAGLT